MAFSLSPTLTFQDSVQRGVNDQIPGELRLLLQKCYLSENKSNLSLDKGRASVLIEYLFDVRSCLCSIFCPYCQTPV